MAKLIHMKEMAGYIRKNLTSAIRKLKRWEDNDLYKGSPKMQEAKSLLKSMYKRYGFDSTKYHSGKIFQSKLTSYMEMKAVYKAVQNIQSANAKEAKAQLEENTIAFGEYMGKVKTAWQKLGKDYKDFKYVSYNDAFDTLSQLSQEFHEIFAFLTYNEVQMALAEKGDEYMNVFTHYAKRLNDKILSEKQVDYALKLNATIASSARFNANQLDDLLKMIPDEYLWK